MLLAEPAGRLLERAGDCAPRGMTVLDRTRLIGQLLSGIPDYSDSTDSIKTKAALSRPQAIRIFRPAENRKDIPLGHPPQPVEWTFSVSFFRQVCYTIDDCSRLSGASD